MYELDREKFGKFIAQLRKEKGYTQKALAEKLSVSDKAVSKWETGKSLPDISLLVPLSQILEVTVTELLESRIIEPAQINEMPVEALVKRTLSYSEESQEKNVAQKRNHFLICIGGIFLSFLEIGLLLFLTRDSHFWKDGAFLSAPYGINLAFCVYFWIFAKEKLPAFYDEYKLHFYSDGILRMNIIGLRFNNRNWPYILRSARLGLLTAVLLCPALYLLLWLFSGFIHREALRWIGQLCILFLSLGFLFVPIYIAGKKYE